MNEYVYSVGIHHSAPDYLHGCYMNITEGKLSASSYSEAMSELAGLFPANDGRLWGDWKPCELGFWTRSIGIDGTPGYRDRIILYPLQADVCPRGEWRAKAMELGGLIEPSDQSSEAIDLLIGGGGA